MQIKGNRKKDFDFVEKKREKCRKERNVGLWSSLGGL
jgi:hypothetical protein